MSVHDCTIFMQNGAPCYRSIIVTDFFRAQKITLLEWPGNSPDLWNSDFQPKDCQVFHRKLDELFRRTPVENY